MNMNMYLGGMAEVGAPHDDTSYAGALPLPDGTMEFPNMTPGQPVYSAAAMQQPIAAKLGLPAQILGFPADRVLIGAALAVVALIVINLMMTRDKS